MSIGAESITDTKAGEVRDWLARLTRADVHNVVWPQVNRQFHGVTLGFREFVNTNYTQPEVREGVFDGIAIALGLLSHVDDIAEVQAMFERPGLPATAGDETA